jgi:mRNA-degrading endonuclease RelE of RelBE toxin-antitoxin system
MQIIYSKYFTKQYLKLPQDIQVRFKSRLKIFIEDSTNSVLNIHGLRGVHAGKYSFNVNADYRVIFEYVDEEVALLLDIGTHAKLYS